VLGVLRGGTGVAALTAGSYLIGNGTGAIVVKTPAQVLGDIGAAAAVHSHEISAVNGLSAALDARPLQTSVTAQISAAVNALIDGAPGAIDTLNELAAAMGDDPNFAATVTNALAAKAPLNSPQFTGTPRLPASGAAVGAGLGLIYSTGTGAVAVRSGDGGAVYFEFSNDGTFKALNGGASFAGNVSATNVNAGSFGSTSANWIAGTSGAGTMYFRPNGIGSVSGQAVINSAGAVSVSGGFSCLTFNATGSDIHLKDDVKLFAPRPLHRLLAALPDSHGAITSYTHRVDGAYRIGPIAQDMERIEPAYMGTIEIEEGQVEGIAAGTYKTVDKASAAYEQAMWAGQEIDRLLARIEALESR
jgi:hypothetical protein